MPFGDETGGEMADLFWLSEAQWAVIEPFMPRNQPGARRVDDRRTISGIIHVIKSGCRWRDCPAEYGPHTTVYTGSTGGPAEASGAGCWPPWPRRAGSRRRRLWSTYVGADSRGGEKVVGTS